ncbi:hypothetical protein BELL_0033g00170 [Botrytis elliptica]|uniref:glucan 1,3-beta-glucosidase n=1 Tax=Botrytis elliptica TaxID=278938 RepID=A0A4Z1K1Q1_9HELO|nr:hypothetical protein EAE99_006947 [Botrytis elliptica]TGO79424.1 hypothetical protein BELL_0033g00170 [Botrytis elliptica]
MAGDATERPHRKSTLHEKRRAERRTRAIVAESEAASEPTGSQTLSIDSLARLKDSLEREKRREERRKSRSRPPVKEDHGRSRERGSPSKDRRRKERGYATEDSSSPIKNRRRERDYDEIPGSPSRERRRRNEYTDDESGSPRKDRRRQERGYTDDESGYPGKDKKVRDYSDETAAQTALRIQKQRRKPNGIPEPKPKPKPKPNAPRKEERSLKIPNTYTDDETVYEKPWKEPKGKKRRVVSGALLEEGEGELKQRRMFSGAELKNDLRHLKGLRGGYAPTESSYPEKYVESDEDFRKRRKRIWMGIGIGIVILIIIIAIAVSTSKKHTSSSSSSTAPATESGTPSNSNLDGMSESDIPVAAQGTYLDPFTWYDTLDFNVTYTNETVGDLPVMGLNISYSDDVAPNPKAPKLSAEWGAYTSRPARGVNLGGWLSIEPFITPSLFNSYSSADGIIDEWTLTTKLGPTAAASTLEKHYATFVSEQTFADIAAAGLDHVRIPFSYWAVITYDDDPYVFRTSWRYLLRGIEWARKYGLRINLDLHALPGSQNGWNHSGRQGAIGWLNGTDGDLNAQRSIEIHDRLSKFFAQDRYKNIISFYGLANEPRMTSLDVNDVLNWTSTVTDMVVKNGISAYVVIGDGFRGLENWQGDLTGYDNLILDVHQYVIFNSGQILYNHTEKVNYACSGWTQQTEISMNTSTGFGPTMVAEWSQADTDCATYLTNVNQGNRWEGTYNTGDSSTQQTTPDCPTQDSTCSCTNANADPSTYSDTYKSFLKMFAEAQMYSFELGWGWFYWTWTTETSEGGGTQWSYQRGLAAGILPKLAYDPDFKCSSTVPSFSALPEYY